MPSEQYLAIERKLQVGDAAAAQAMLALAQAGDADALLKAAELRLRGVTGKVDVQGAMKLMNLAADKGHTEARRAEAYFLALGIGADPDPEKAKAMLERIATEDRFVAVQLAFLKHVHCHARLETANRQLLSRDPHVEVVQGLFSPEECRYIQMLAQPWLEPARVYSDQGGSRLDPMRDALNMAFTPMREDLVIQAINRCIADAAEFPVTWGEPLHVMHYRPGQQFRPHHDAHGPGRGKRVRIATALLYLNSDYEGGETHFPELGFRVRGGAGDLLIFHNVTADNQPDPRVVHAGLPIVRGEKWLATRWIRGTDFYARSGSRRLASP